MISLKEGDEQLLVDSIVQYGTKVMIVSNGSYYPDLQVGTSI